MKANKNIKFIDCFVAEQSDKITLGPKTLVEAIKLGFIKKRSDFVITWCPNEAEGMRNCSDIILFTSF